MRDVKDGELGDALRIQQSGAPGNGGAPIMSSEKDFFLAEFIGDGDDVGDELRHGIPRDAGGFAAQVVPALVGDDDAKACSRQRLDLPAPTIPKFGESVEQNDHGRILRPGGSGVQSDVRVLEEDSFQRMTPDEQSTLSKRKRRSGSWNRSGGGGSGGGRGQAVTDGN